MDGTVSSERLAWLWDRYVEVSRRYVAVKRATDAAEAARDAAHQRCDEASHAWEVACAEEIRCGQALRRAALEFQVASDAAFLVEVGIQPSSVLPGEERMIG